MVKKGKDLTQIRWHARGGQGAKTAADFVTRVAISKGKYSQAFPEYGPERAGAPMKSYTRISSEPIKLHSAVYKPDIVVVLDPSLIEIANVSEGLEEDGVMLVNTTLAPDEAISTYKLEGIEVHTVDATRIALDTIGRNIPNTPMVGALLKISGILELDDTLETLKKSFGKKFGEDIIKKNLSAVKRAYEEVK